MKIPEPVKEAARGMSEMFGEKRIKYLGEREDGSQVYIFTLPSDRELGFPQVYIFDGKKVQTVYGHDALAVSRSFRK